MTHTQIGCGFVSVRAERCGSDKSFARVNLRQQRVNRIRLVSKRLKWNLFFLHACHHIPSGGCAAGFDFCSLTNPFSIAAKRIRSMLAQIGHGIESSCSPPQVGQVVFIGRVQGLCNKSQPCLTS
jgi:hypothetical protein